MSAPAYNCSYEIRSLSPEESGRYPTAMRVQDWEHRLTVLRAWQYWYDGSRIPDFPGRDQTYRAVLDGCAITVRALCQVVGVRADFRSFDAGRSDRTEALLACCKKGRDLVEALDPNARQHLLEVLYLGNRAVAHPDDGDEAALDHKVGQPEMTSAINTLLRWLVDKQPSFSGLQGVPPALLQPIPAPLT